MKLSKKFGYFPTCSLTDSQWEKNYASLWAAWATGYLFSSSIFMPYGSFSVGRFDYNGAQISNNLL